MRDEQVEDVVIDRSIRDGVDAILAQTDAAIRPIIREMATSLELPPHSVSHYYDRLTQWLSYETTHNDNVGRMLALYALEKKIGMTGAWMILELRRAPTYDEIVTRVCPDSVRSLYESYCNKMPLPDDPVLKAMAQSESDYARSLSLDETLSVYTERLAMKIQGYRAEASKNDEFNWIIINYYQPHIAPESCPSLRALSLLKAAHENPDAWRMILSTYLKQVDAESKVAGSDAMLNDATITNMMSEIIAAFEEI